MSYDPNWDKGMCTNGAPKVDPEESKNTESEIKVKTARKGNVQRSVPLPFSSSVNIKSRVIAYKGNTLVCKSCKTELYTVARKIKANAKVTSSMVKKKGKVRGKSKPSKNWAQVAECCGAEARVALTGLFYVKGSDGKLREINVK